MREDEMLQLLQLMRSLVSDDRVASLYADKTASILRGDRLKRFNAFHCLQCPRLLNAN